MSGVTRTPRPRDEGKYMYLFKVVSLNKAWPVLKKALSLT